MIVAFPAFLDSCTLVPINLTDVLLRRADAGTFRPLWSAHILDEVRRNFPKIGVAPERADRRIEMMRASFPDAEVTGYESPMAPVTAATALARSTAMPSSERGMQNNSSSRKASPARTSRARHRAIAQAERAVRRWSSWRHGWGSRGPRALAPGRPTICRGFARR